MTAPSSVQLMLLTLLIAIHLVNTQQCLLTGNRQGLPPFMNYRGGGVERNRIRRGSQAIIPSYRFDCCGNITGWAVDVHPARPREDLRYTLELQVWRPAPTVDTSTGTGCYSLVGNNRFSSIRLRDEVARVTPSPQDYIQFRPGDVLGFYVEAARNREDGVVILDSPARYMRELVWHASIENDMTSSRDADCPYSIGDGGELNTLSQAAPVILISTNTHPCLSTPAVSSLPTTTDREPVPTTFSGPRVSPPAPLNGNNRTSSESNANVTTEAVNTNDQSWIIGVTLAAVLLVALITVTAAVITCCCRRYSKKAQSMSTHQRLFMPVEHERNIQGTLATDYKCMGSAVEGTTPKTSKQTVTKKPLPQGAHTPPLIVPITYKRKPKAVESLEGSGKRSKQLNEPPVETTSNIYSAVSTGIDSKERPVVKKKLSNTVDVKLSSVPATHKQKADEEPTDHKYTSVPTLNRTPGQHVYEKGDIGCSAQLQTLASRYEMCNMYDDPSTNLKGAETMERRLRDSEDVFDRAGMYVPTMEQRKSFEGHYAMQETMAYSRLKFFEENDVYWTPAFTTSELYSQLASKKYREIARNQINITSQLGSGEFGEVCKAKWTISGATKELAIKTLRPELPEEEKVRFLQEAAIMGQFSHPNVVKLYGVVTLEEPVMICIEMMKYGDLRKYLTSIVPERQNPMEMKVQFLRFSKQIASGMDHLARKSFVHRDLAARNIMLDDSLTCKIGDFGMARDLEDEMYYTATTKGAKIPVKWTAPEALLYKKYSTDSDVWSYGMVLFEIWSVGKKPFSQLTNVEVLIKFKSNLGYNQPPPPGCPRAIYKLMVDCWNPEHSKRPSFSNIFDYLSASSKTLLQEADNPYANVPNGANGQLGVELCIAESVYEDLQNVYYSSPN